MSCPVVFCFDKNYAPYCAVAIFSLIVSNGSSIRIYCLYDETVGDEDLYLIRKLKNKYKLDLNEIKVDTARINDLQVHSHYTPAVYTRLMIPDLLENESKALYLDCDLIVSKDLSELLMLDIGNCIFAGVYAAYGESVTRIKTKKDGYYVNSGVLLMDLEALRAEHFFENSLSLYQKNANDIVLVDQCLINLYADGRKYILDQSFNYRILSDTISKKEWSEVCDQMHIYHFVGETKPWHKWSRLFITNFWYKYADMLDSTRFPIVESNLITNLIKQTSSLEEDGNYKESCDLKGVIINSLLNHIQNPQ